MMRSTFESRNSAVGAGRITRAVSAPWPVPAEWRVTTLEADMDAPVECAQCGRTLPFGETFTSLEVHELGAGFGYAVCGECHAQERWRRIEHARVGSER